MERFYSSGGYIKPNTRRRLPGILGKLAIVVGVRKYIVAFDASKLVFLGISIQEELRSSFWYFRQHPCSISLKA